MILLDRLRLLTVLNNMLKLKELVAKELLVGPWFICWVEYAINRTDNDDARDFSYYVVKMMLFFVFLFSFFLHLKKLNFDIQFFA